ncbi:MAG: RNA polymerase sigma factor FliA [Sulfurimonas sp. RIFCSPHIGHO2_12_FULL_36_9]|jgi:RNA polymerase sigma factor for flagellar operon FliA|uniref:RNA polymerase sigma factor FliA n=1 Tax=Sulfurimonas sp. RIFCSPLOWO2_12_36_12 TaxID=1802253 RepID=UPI0008D3874B|nr:RNA polymerase sigma factor FliA [Sulfurimonas sp. RIFCSPLOWO2_12_36_12]OHD96856.1 MAG: RNA polymerase sigma factor FliA [Sulfurimonas sp. RIFCSPHIGHO2_12_FULL_36_9]OHD99092.1 MAG: RNA polymerase sigma factor FliA [Sulfurimonas sp. RIFCSPLOWO2_02_FULL_36_28]OHE00098.1 MAG: RNA polymerase sigma factor FliA [Sulfurimonas sp. RIFCSPLOWO2_12_36_12]OHE07248.1 MAG: RNA polymerase sigma factor FliA [Sulfurimonas sp. RIFCSPLOWO2_12_FULL_36_74]
MIAAYTQDLKHKKDELAIQYLPAVKAMAFRLKERLPSSVDYMDLSAIGTEELIKLARKYDEKLNDSFWGYAKKRVYGAMLDYLRSLDILSRSSRKLIKAIDYAVEDYRAIHDEEPSDEQLAAILNESVEKIHEARIASSIYTVMPLQDQLQAGDEGLALANIEKDELINVIKTVLGQYSEREQLIIQFYYFEELSLKEISDVLNITESRISQIHKSVIHKIRESVGA